jgi:hypothetical protein
VVILKFVNTFTPTITAGLTASTSSAVAGYTVYTISAGTGTITFN